jgi:hypothetical protein
MFKLLFGTSNKLFDKITQRRIIILGSTHIFPIYPSLEHYSGIRAGDSSSLVTTLMPRRKGRGGQTSRESPERET